MRQEVLEIHKYPEIVFQSHNIRLNSDRRSGPAPCRPRVAPCTRASAR
jgi:hypothetical protein